MAANRGVAIRAFPFLFFLLKKLIHPVIPYVLLVLYHAHAVSFFIRVIKLLQFFTWEIGTFVAEPYLSFT